MLLKDLIYGLGLYMSDDVWKDLHANYEKQDWVKKPSLFAQTVIQYFPRKGKILELGAGHGQDSVYFAENNFDVVSTDIEISSLAAALAKQTESIKSRIKIQEINLKNRLPYDDNIFDVVYSHLALHYFDKETTCRIFDEIERVLKPGGIFAFLTNSTSDPESTTGTQLEKDFFLIGKATKRYFDVDTAREFTRGFQVQLIDNFGKTYKDEAKGISQLIRFVGNKPREKNYNMAIPYVGAIIERIKNGAVEVLLQTRWKPHSDPIYSGTYEFPAGTLDKPYENIYATLAREIDEECGLKLKEIKNDSQTSLMHTNKDDAVFGFQPFCCTQQLKNGKPWIGCVFICEVEEGEPRAQPGESKDIQWVAVDEVKKIFTESPEKLFALQLPAWEYYFYKRI